MQSLKERLAAREQRAADSEAAEAFQASAMIAQRQAEAARHAAEGADEERVVTAVHKAARKAVAENPFGKAGGKKK